MRRAGILLRIVLGLSLMLDGIAGSGASAAMAAALSGPSNGADSEALSTAEARRSGCTDHESALKHETATSPEPAGGRPADSGCCGIGLCGCACAHLSSLAALQLLFVPPNLGPVSLSDAIASSRPAPALPHLIRPPIA